jgi:colanic acid/amylovoran biosynthesis glycosyltransferase
VKAPLRIAFFVGVFPVPSETFILRQITGLLDLGHEVHIFANARGEERVVHEAVRRYDLIKRTTFVEGPAESVVWEMPVRPLRGETWLPGAEKPMANLARLVDALPVLQESAVSSPALTRHVLSRAEYGYRSQSLSGAYRLATLLRSGQKFDLLHMHFGPIANAFRFARELFQVPLVVSFHGYDFCTVPRKEGNNVYEHLWPVADVVLANSNYTHQQLRALGCPKSKLRLLPVGLNPSEFEFCERTIAPNEVIRFLTVARLVEIKGHEYALRAFADFRQTYPKARLDLVGDGPLRLRLESLIRELSLQDAVTLHGSRSELEVREFFARAHVFLLTSVNVNGDEEGQGLVLQEAQACGLPVIATRHGAFPEGVAPANASWLVPERDVEALAVRLREMVADQARWPVMGRAGREFVEHHYDIRLLNQQLVDLYRGAVSTFKK